jgi:tetratricopeptide (TPR) repeat protein
VARRGPLDDATGGSLTSDDASPEFGLSKFLLACRIPAGVGCPDWSAGALTRAREFRGGRVSMPQTDEVAQLFVRAKALVVAGQLAAAVEALQVVCQLDDDHADAHEQLGFLYFQTADYPRAIDEFTHVTRLDPKRASAYINMGAVFNKQENYARALDCFRKGIGLDRRSADAFYNLGLAHRKLKQYSMAIPAYKEAIRLNPMMAEAYQNLGNVYLDMGSHQQAISQFRKALEIRPEFERARRGLEKAEAAVTATRRNENPFGRLVKLPSAEDQKQVVTARTLSAEDREHDRHVLFQLSEEVEEETKAFVDMLKIRLLPALRDLSKSVAGDQTVDFADAHNDFRRVVAEFAPRSKRLLKLTDQLKTHEDGMA